VKRETRVSGEAAALFGTRRVLARRGWAGEKFGLFEQPAASFSSHNSDQLRLVHIRFSPDAAPLLAARVWLFGEGE
jgi:hypothetical protein